MHHQYLSGRSSNLLSQAHPSANRLPGHRRFPFFLPVSLIMFLLGWAGCGEEQPLLTSPVGGGLAGHLAHGNDGERVSVTPYSPDNLESLHWQYSPWSQAFMGRREAANQGKSRGSTQGGRSRSQGFKPSPWDHSHLGRSGHLSPRVSPPGEHPGDGGHLHGYTHPVVQNQPRGFLPPAHDSRDFNRAPPVRDQGDCGSCWAFASLGNLEIGLMPEELWDFSENHMKNRHGFDSGHCDGGNYFMAGAYLSRFAGPVLEEDDPYRVDSSHSPDNLSPSHHVHGYLFLPDRTGPLDNELIKSAVYQYGSVATSMYSDSDSSYNQDTFAYYGRSAVDADHGVIIAGWDDQFSARHFTSTPPGDGAFIVRNSWGSDWGEGGYFYVSYYDVTIGLSNVVFTGVSEAPLYDYIYMYDPLGFTQALGNSDDTAWAANVFTASSQEHLKGVGTFSLGDQLHYQLFIYLDPLSSPVDGVLAGQMEGTLEGAGYHQIPVGHLDVILEEGERFAVVLKMTTPGYEYPVPVEVPVAGYSSGASAGEGESFGSWNGAQWFDVAQLSPGVNVCIRAFTDVACDDGNLCTVDFWDGTACQHEPVINGTPCDGDSDGCTVGDSCQGGVCMPGPAPDCSGAGDQCRVGVCVSTGPDSYRCEPDSAPMDGAPCDSDGDGCTVGDSCRGGVCVPGPAPDCSGAGEQCVGGVCVSTGPDSYRCEPDTTPMDGAPCDSDGDGCTVGDFCRAGVCIPGAAPDCSRAGDQCHVGACVSTGPNSYRCYPDSGPMDGASCDSDGDGCTVGDSCLAGVCVPGPAPDCSGAGDQCRVGVCVSTGADAYRCESDPVPLEGASCDSDGDGCTVGDSCLAGVCVPGSAPDCSGAGDQCLVGVCVSTGIDAYRCESDPVPLDGAPCDSDGDGCTVGDSCLAGVCVPGPAPDCSEVGDQCNGGLCVSTGPDSFTCGTVPLGEGVDGVVHCDDGDPCTVDDVCVEGACVGVPRDCSPPDGECAVGSCNRDTGECEFVLHHGQCDDGDPCTVGTCTAEEGCVYSVVEEGAGCLPQDDVGVDGGAGGDTGVGGDGGDSHDGGTGHPSGEGPMGGDGDGGVNQEQGGSGDDWSGQNEPAGESFSGADQGCGGCVLGSGGGRPGAGGGGPGGGGGGLWFLLVVVVTRRFLISSRLRTPTG